MKKLFTFLLALVVGVGTTFAARDVVPSDAVLKNYYKTGQLCVCIFVPAEMACNDVVFVGTYNRDASDAWITDVNKLAKFQPVEGYDGWYVIAVNDETPANFENEKGIQGKPIVLDQDGAFNWQYQVSAATKIRGGVEIVNGAYLDEIDLIRYTKDAPNVYTIDALKGGNPCTYEDSSTIYGTCGNNVTWTLSNGTLTISGTGAIADFLFYSPWYDYSSSIKSVIINDGVTSIGNRAFYGCSSLTSVTIPNSVTGIGDYAFYECSSLTSITIPNSVTSIGGSAFRSCSSLTSITIPNSVTSIGNAAFADCSSLASVTIEAETPPTLGNSVFTSTNNCPIYVPCGTLDAYKTAWSAYASRIKYAPYSSYTINKKAENGHITTSSTDFTMCDTEHPVICTATPNRGYYFVRWADGSTENPRTIELTQDTTMEAIFDYLLEGKCGKDSALTWTLDTTTMALNITGNGALSENYTYAPFIQSLTIGNGVTSIGSRAFVGCSSLTSITIPNSVTSIGDGAFSECSKLTSVTIGNGVTSIGSRAFAACSSLTSVTIPNSVTGIGDRAFADCESLKTVVLGSSVKVLETSAFAYCSALETITCYSMRPPTVNQDALYGLDYSTIVYVPADYLNTYKMHDAWGLYDVRPLGATSAETEDVKITPSENEANVTWPSVTGAASYELVIKDKNGNIVCTLIFNANGQLTSIAFNAPSRNGVPAQTQNAGFSFTITGLDSGTGYDLTLTAKDNSGNIIEETTIPFHTDYPEGIDNVQGDELQSTKVIKDGQVLILRNGKTYTMQGQEVK